MGITKVFLTGYTPYPLRDSDVQGLSGERLPHLAQKIHKQIKKTALGAEESQPWEHDNSVERVIAQLREKGFVIAAIEQAPGALALPDFQPPEKVALIVGREVEGIEPELLQLCDHILEIPMFGRKESFNVVQAAAMGLYHCRFNAFTS